MRAANQRDDSVTPVDVVRLHQRLLAEGVRCLESRRETPIDDHAAIEQARALCGENVDDEAFIVTRAALLPVASKLEAGFAVQRRIGWLIGGVAVVLAVMLGVSAARVTLSVERGAPVNIFWLLGAVLGGQTFLLLVWAVAAMLGPRVLGGVSIGGWIVQAGVMIVRRVRHDAAAAAALEAMLGLFAAGAIGRWLLSTIAHAAWTLFNLALIATLILLLSARQYTFSWESTILSPASFQRLTEGLAHGPRLAGFLTPGSEQINAARFDPTAPELFAPQNDETRAAWSGLLIGAAACYGLAPRLLLFACSAIMLMRSMRRYRLPLDHPGHARLVQRRKRPYADPARRGNAPIDTAPAPAPHERTPRAAGAPAIVGIELHPLALGWPPPTPGVPLDDLGLIEDRAGRRRLIDRLRGLAREPFPLIVVVDLTVTPDRGLAHLLAELRATVEQSPTLILTSGEALRRRAPDAEHVQQRVEDWRTVAREAGYQPDRIIEFDLDHLTNAGAAMWRAIVRGDGEQTRAAASSHLREAFTLIEEHALRWSESGPSADDQRRLHEAIAALYRHDGRLKSFLRSVTGRGSFENAGLEEWTGAARHAAVTVRDWLPASLRLSPRWAGAGALAGAVGCVAAAAVLSPVAIGSLPLWSIIGGAVGGLLGPRVGFQTSSSDADEREWSATIRAALLFALVLELQPREAADIARIMERILPEDEADDALTMTGDRESLRRRLDHLAERLHETLAREGRP